MKAKLIAACGLKYLEFRRKFTRRGGKISAYVTKINDTRKVRIKEICYIIRAFLRSEAKMTESCVSQIYFAKRGEVTPQMREVAQSERMDVRALCDLIAQG